MSVPAIGRISGEPVSKIEILVSCNHLLDRDVASKSDPCCILEMKNKNASWYEVGRTEVIKNCLAPQFARSIEVDYFFEEVQQLRFSINDVDDMGKDSLGRLECTLGEVVSGSPFTRPLKSHHGGNAGKGTITVRAQEIGTTRDCLLMQFCAKNLDSKDFMGKSDPYLEFSRRMPDGGYQVVHRTEVVKNELNPRWRPIEIKASRLCGGDYKTSIKVECSDYDNDGSHDLIGSFETTVEELMKGTSKQLEWPCINPKKKAKKKSYQNSGIVYLASCKVTKLHTFLDYIFGGLQINFTVGIDFTASNGNPNTPSSLHYVHPSQPNHYMRAIQSVGQVIQDYDSDQMFPALGYGAKIPPNMEVSHVFALNFNAANPFCAGIQGILDAYRMCLSYVQLYGPTNFAPIIHHAAQFAVASQKDRAAKNYFILLIITDGVISDMADTIRAIVYASALPFSLIIVGVGTADFSAMVVLDGDNGVLRDNSGNVCRRDIVQFVPFRQFEGASPAALAKQVLAEIPEQVVGYFKMNGIEPGPPGSKAPGQGPFQANPSGPGGVPTPFAQATGPGQQQPTAAGQLPTGQGLYPSVGEISQHPGGPGQPGQQPGGQAPYPGQPPRRQVPCPPGQQPGQAPYPGQEPGQALYPQGQQPGQAPYLPNQRPGQAPYPGQQPGQAAPYPGQQPGQAAPYPGQQPGPAPYPGQQPGQAAPYPGQQPGQAPYPGQQPGQAPYPQGQQHGQAPYSQGQQHGQAPYPGQQPGQAAPYPGQQPGQAPYPGQQPGQAPYPQAQQHGQAPYSQGQQHGQAPYPPSQQPGQAPYPGQQPGQAPYPSGQQPGGFYTAMTIHAVEQHGSTQTNSPSNPAGGGQGSQAGGLGAYQRPAGPGAYVTPGGPGGQGAYHQQ